MNDTNDVEFLRKRLAEDAAVAREAFDAALAGRIPPRTPTGDGMPTDFELRFEPEFVLLDLEAKANIVEDCAAILAAGNMPGAARLARRTLRSLAGAYEQALGVAAAHSGGSES